MLEGPNQPGGRGAVTALRVLEGLGATKVHMDERPGDPATASPDAG